MWSAPYTLDNVPITGYNINDDQGTLLDTVNTAEYILTGDYCDITTVYVSGINGAGIGDSNNVTFYITRGKYYDYEYFTLELSMNFSSSNCSNISCSKSGRKSCLI